MKALKDSKGLHPDRAARGRRDHRHSGRDRHSQFASYRQRGFDARANSDLRNAATSRRGRLRDLPGVRDLRPPRPVRPRCRASSSPDTVAISMTSAGGANPSFTGTSNSTSGSGARPSRTTAPRAACSKPPVTSINPGEGSRPPSFLTLAPPTACGVTQACAPLAAALVAAWRRVSVAGWAGCGDTVAARRPPSRRRALHRHAATRGRGYAECGARTITSPAPIDRPAPRRAGRRCSPSIGAPQRPSHLACSLHGNAALHSKASPQRRFVDFATSDWRRDRRKQSLHDARRTTLRFPVTGSARRPHWYTAC